MVKPQHQARWRRPDGTINQHTTHHHGIYRLSCEDFEQLLARSGERCEICGAGDIKLLIDHSHTPVYYGPVRGLVCSKCNTHEVRGLRPLPAERARLGLPRIERGNAPRDHRRHVMQEDRPAGSGSDARHTEDAAPGDPRSGSGLGRRASEGQGARRDRDLGDRASTEEVRAEQVSGTDPVVLLLFRRAQGRLPLSTAFQLAAALRAANMLAIDYPGAGWAGDRIGDGIGVSRGNTHHVFGADLDELREMLETTQAAYDLMLADGVPAS